MVWKRWPGGIRAATCQPRPRALSVREKGPPPGLRQKKKKKCKKKLVDWREPALQGDHHGCPYKTFDKETLRAALCGMRVSDAAAEEVVAKAKAGHYQLACAMAFEATHGCECDTGINHPNQVPQLPHTATE
jgi:Eukaryotic and archaeal DNA primase, large subunit